MVFIDWEGAGPSTRLWDLVCAAVSFGHLFPRAEPEAGAARLAAFLEGYGADQSLRDVLPATLARRSRAMYDLLRRAHEAGEQPWCAMYEDGHGDLWQATTRFIGLHRERWELACGSSSH